MTQVSDELCCKIAAIVMESFVSLSRAQDRYFIHGDKTQFIPRLRALLEAELDESDEIERLREKIGREPTFFYRGCVAHAGYKFYANGEITWKPIEQYALASKGEEPSAEPPTTAPIGSGTSPAVGEAAEHIPPHICLFNNGGVELNNCFLCGRRKPA